MTRAAPADADPNAPLAETHFNRISSNYFQVLGIPLLQGRTFADAETGLEQTRVAVISEAMRRAYWTTGSPIGQRFRYGQNDIAEVVGVVPDLRATHVATVDGPTFYLPVRPSDTPTIVARSADIRTTSAVIQQLVRQHDASALISTRTMEDNLRDALTPTRAGAVSALALAVLAMALAAIGIYGVTSYVVSQRTREVGIRLALGAEPPAIRWLIVRQAMRSVGIGALVGLPLAAVVSMTASKMLLGVHPLDPIAFLGACVFLCGVAFVASYVPARRATRVNPVIALRHA